MQISTDDNKDLVKMSEEELLNIVGGDGCDWMDKIKLFLSKILI